MLKEQIEKDFIVAFKSKDEIVSSTLKMLKSSIKNKEIELIKELDDELIIKLIMSEIKKRKDSATQFEQGGRTDLAEKEKSEILILEKYLPEMISDDEIKKIICAIIEESKIEKIPTNFGVVMKLSMEKLSGKADGTKVSQILKEILQ